MPVTNSLKDRNRKFSGRSTKISDTGSRGLGDFRSSTSTVVQFKSDDDQNECNVEIEVQLQREYGHRQGRVDDHCTSYNKKPYEVT